MTRVGQISNDLYLRSQGESRGITSYGRVVDLLLAERRAQRAAAQSPAPSRW